MSSYLHDHDLYPLPILAFGLEHKEGLCRGDILFPKNAVAGRDICEFCKEEYTAYTYMNKCMNKRCLLFWVMGNCATLSPQKTAQLRYAHICDECDPDAI